MVKLLKRLLVGGFLLFVGLVILAAIAAKPTKPTKDPRAEQAKAESQPAPARSEPEPKPEPEPEPEAKSTGPSNFQVERVARKYFDQLESKIVGVNPDASKRTWNGHYSIRPYPDSTGAWVVDFVGKGKTQWSMVVVCENDKWGLARCTAKGKHVYENPEIHFDENKVWRLK